MTKQRLRRCALGLAGLIAIPPLLWIGVVLLAPTAWARRHVVAAMEASSGRSVVLERLDVPLLGGLELSGLTFGSPKNTDDPWLKAEKVRVDVKFGDLLRGKFVPSSIEIEGTSLRVLRRADGSLELADFILPPPKPAGTHRHDDAPNKSPSTSRTRRSR